MFKVLFDFLFPKNEIVVVYDKIDKKVLEKFTRQTLYDAEIKCLAPFSYKEKAIKNAIYACKYHSHKKTAVLLGEILSPHLAEELADKRMFETFIKPIIVPVPLHKERLLERGFNQAERISKALINSICDDGITLRTDILVRVKKTKSQAHNKNRRERFENMKNAFNVEKIKDVYGKDIILLDDVVTTGATLSSAKKTLEKAGARNVLCVAVAH